MMAETQTPEGESQEPNSKDHDNAVEVQKGSASGTLDDLKNWGVATQSRNIDFLLDVPLQLSVEIGRTKMRISELLKLSQGSVIELSQMVEEPMDVLINGELVAKGEVVVANERFGIRITDIVSPVERIESLK